MAHTQKPQHGPKKGTRARHDLQPLIRGLLNTPKDPRWPGRPDIDRTWTVTQIAEALVANRSLEVQTIDDGRRVGNPRLVIKRMGGIYNAVDELVKKGELIEIRSDRHPGKRGRPTRIYRFNPPHYLDMNILNEMNLCVAAAIDAGRASKGLGMEWQDVFDLVRDEVVNRVWWRIREQIHKKYRMPDESLQYLPRFGTKPKEPVDELGPDDEISGWVYMTRDRDGLWSVSTKDSDKGPFLKVPIFQEGTRANLRGDLRRMADPPDFRHGSILVDKKPVLKGAIQEK